MISHKVPLDHKNEWNNLHLCITQATTLASPTSATASSSNHQTTHKRKQAVSPHTHFSETTPEVSSTAADLRTLTPTKRSPDRRKTATWNLQDLLPELKQPPRTAIPQPAWTFHSIFTDPAWPTRELLPIILAPGWRKETYNDVLSVGTR